MQRLHHEGVHDLLRAPSLRPPRVGPRHPERHHVGAGAAPRRRRGRAHRDPRRDPYARRRTGGPGLGMLAGALFPDHPLGRDTLGTASSVRRITPDDIASFLAHHYRPANMVVSVAGDCTHELVAAALEERFAGVPGGAAPARTAPGPDAVNLEVVRRTTEQAHLVYGARSVSRFDERRWALAVLNHVLGGGLSSRLFQKVREQRGLAYSVWSERAAYADAGLAGGRGRYGTRARRRGAAHRQRRARAPGERGGDRAGAGGRQGHTCAPRCCSRARTREPG